ncbi:8-oxoguanine deaminase, partial [Pseudomonas aeruginosa]
LCGADRAYLVLVGGGWRVVDGSGEGLFLAALIAIVGEAASALIAG